ncbi:hypothetical protein O6H91_04G074000 [Diphasiastrum complanatum]|uniref:Uncharacterized protein n=2 Tax=Diphasiastrum complanatum TaxID=34168 RepID=A0ACC2DYB0_DIPCM|nr:hypothetical protein O6H91_04G074000 [Diphasiastrum complanatum]KAJ7559197.1 hypothetical protein O6H91_04G074000 [Diphasiastrum complanatum]
MSSAAKHCDAPEQNEDVRDKKKRKKVGFSKDANVDFCEAKDCIKLHLIGDGNDIQSDSQGEDNGNDFSPTFVEEFFEGGRIYGYRGLRIDIWLHDSTFLAYAEVRYDSKLQVNGSRKGTKDVEAILKEIFGESLIMDRGTFIERLANAGNYFRDLITAHGDVVATWESSPAPSSSAGNLQGHVKHCEIVRMEIHDPSLREWRSSLSPLVLLFIEGGRPIDSDPQWEIFVATEKHKGSERSCKVTGFCNVFRFYHYPDSMRLRISQILVLPPYQQKGYGFHLLESVNKVALQRGCFDVNMEEPSEKLQELRDCMDSLRLLSHPTIVSAILGDVAQITKKREEVQKGIVVEKTSLGGSELQEVLHMDVHSLSRRENGDLVASDSVKRQGWHILMPPKALIDVARKIYKISKSQVKRCWEILIFLHLDPLDTSALETYSQLLATKLKYEVFEKDNNEAGRSKKVVDTKNEHDSSKTFVMMRFKSSAKNNADVSRVANEVLAGMEDVVEVEETNNKNEVLQELLEERENEILSVVKKVRRFRSG